MRCEFFSPFWYGFFLLCVMFIDVCASSYHILLSRYSFISRLLTGCSESSGCSHLHLRSLGTLFIAHTQYNRKKGYGLNEPSLNTLSSIPFFHSYVTLCCVISPPPPIITSLSQGKAPKQPFLGSS